MKRHLRSNASRTYGAESGASIYGRICRPLKPCAPFTQTQASWADRFTYCTTVLEIWIRAELPLRSLVPSGLASRACGWHWRAGPFPLCNALMNRGWHWRKSQLVASCRCLWLSRPLGFPCSKSRIKPLGFWMDNGSHVKCFCHLILCAAEFDRPRKWRLSSQRNNGPMDGRKSAPRQNGHLRAVLLTCKTGPPLKRQSKMITRYYKQSRNRFLWRTNMWFDG